MNLPALLLLFGSFTFRCISGNEATSNDTVDALRAVASLPHAVLLAATVDLPMLECLTADVTSFDSTAMTASYVWHMKGVDGQDEKSITVDYRRSKDRPDMAVAYLNSDTSFPIVTQVVYSDYKNCVINKMFFGSHERGGGPSEAAAGRSDPYACSSPPVAK
ncbi:uncharacterized protein LOC144097437 isoform X2 [Amblyomma americanum]